MPEDRIKAAKAVLASHEENLLQGDVDAIMSNMADDVVIVAPGSPPLEGREACRAMYVGLLEMGSWDLGHDYGGAVVDGSSVLLHGVARGVHTPPDGDARDVANSFLLAVRPDATGRLKLWRAAFGPSGEAGS